MNEETGALSRALIIDSDPQGTMPLQGILASSGYEAMHANDVAEGLKAMREWEPNAVFVSLRVLGDQPADTFKRMRAALSGRVPLIAIATPAERTAALEAVSSGADDFVTKPFNATEVAARLRAQERVSEFYNGLSREHRTLNELLSAINDISASLDPSQVLETIVRQVARAMDAERCSIVLVGADGAGQVLASHEAPEVKDLKVDLSKYPEIREVIKTKTPVVIDDMVSHPLLSGVRKDLGGLGGVSLLIVPIVFSDEVLGTLFLRAKRKAGFTEKEIDFCKTIAASSFFALRNAQLFDRTRREREYLKEIAVRDQLTSLYNHNFFYSRLDEEFERAIRYSTPLSIIMLDIDNFKDINDTYGHRVGDAVLREISAIIKRGTRKSDIVARYGGEEFAVILPHTNLKGAIEEAERLRELVEIHAYAGLVTNRITVSIGVSSYPYMGAANSGDLVNYADDALYKAKWSGKNCVKVGGEP